jgi:hypothetical protein
MRCRAVERQAMCPGAPRRRWSDAKKRRTCRSPFARCARQFTFAKARMPVLRRNCNDRSGSKADIPERSSVVRFASESGHRRTRQACPLSAKSRHWPRQSAYDFCHLFDGAFGRAPVGRVRARVALRLTCPFVCAFSARAIASSTSFSASVTSSHLTIVTHLPFSRSL